MSGQEQEREQEWEQAQAELGKNRGGDTKEARSKKPSLLRDIGTILMWCAHVFAAMLVAESIIAVIRITFFGGSDAISAPALALLYIVYDIAAVGLVVFVPRCFRAWRARQKRAKTSRRQKGTSKPSGTLAVREELGTIGLPTWTDIGLAPIGYIASLFLSAGLTAIFSRFAWFDANEVQDVGFSGMMTSGDKIAAFLAVAVLAPIAEELIFRGWLYGRVRTRLSRRLPEIWAVIFASVIVSLLFAVLHGQWNVGVTVFALSIILCGLREITGTVYSGILVHSIKNAVAFILLFVLSMV